MRSFLKRASFLIIILAVVIVIGTAGFMYLQKLSLFDAFYFTVITISTVGYGDIVPIGTASRILSIVVVLAGVGVFTGLVVNFAEYLIERQTEKIRRERLNMLVELFYSEIGQKMLRYFAAADPGLEQFRDRLNRDQATQEAELSLIREKLKNHVYSIDPLRFDPAGLKSILEEGNSLLLRLLENPNLIENEAFTDILRTTFHFRQELAARGDLTSLPQSDLEHLANDARRAYAVSAQEWLNHAYYLKTNYPYLFSLTMRTHPFKAEPEPVIH